MSSLSTLPKGDSAWLLRKSIQRIMQQVSVLETNIGSSTTGNSADTQVIFNDAGTLRGDTGLTFNKTTDLLTVGAATITGDLTVDTNVLKVDSANNRVGILTASPAQSLDVASGNLQVRTGGIIYSDSFSNYGAALQINAAGSLPLRLQIGGTTAYEITSANVHTWQNVGGVAGTAMTLNATGLGVFNTPVAALDVYKVANDTINRTNATFCFGQIAGLGAALLGQQSASAPYQFNLQAANAANSVQFPLVLQPSGGNVGIGVTPSAWAAGFKVIQASTGVAISTNAVVDRCDISANYYFNAGNKFLNATGRASNFSQDGGAFYFYQSTGTSGGVGSAITWGPGMTLDASGNLLVGTTGPNTTWSTKLTLSSDSGTTKWAVGPYDSGGTFFMVSAGGSTGVYLNGTAATSWTSASDERLKDIIEPISNAVSKVASLRAVIGKFKFDENNTRKPFLIAQDIQAVLPEAVDSSNPDRLGVSYTDVIPLLVAAIKELTARVQTLETR